VGPAAEKGGLLKVRLPGSSSISLICELLHTWKKCLICLLIARHIPKLIFFYQEVERTAIKPSRERRKSHAQFAACVSPLGLQGLMQFGVSQPVALGCF